MDPEGLSLKQCGQSTIPIFPAHPEYSVYRMEDSHYDPVKQGFRPEYGTLVRPKKQKDSIKGYEIYNVYPSVNQIDMHEAQNVGDTLSEMYRSLHFSMRAMLIGVSKLNKELERQKDI